MMKKIKCEKSASMGVEIPRGRFVLIKDSLDLVINHHFQACSTFGGGGEEVMFGFPLYSYTTRPYSCDKFYGYTHS